ncbi:MAG: ribonuclease Z [Ruminococcaceae bacterium]|nr:ribonuclease Z [Oscillospiraceae bacterium]
MKLIFCISKDNGMMFFGKRQSKDAVLRQWILEYIGSSKLWMSQYSAKQFEEIAEICVDDDYIIKAGKDDYCFVEDKSYSAEGVNEIVLCKWNRAYPGDKFFDIDLKANGFKKSNSVDIAGSSHEKITIEIYTKQV